MSSARNPRRFLYLLVTVLVVGAGLVFWTVGSRAETTEPAQPAPTEEPAAPAAAYVGSDTCGACHQEVGPALTAGLHGAAMGAAETAGRGHLCEGCHGPGSLHADDPANTDVSGGLRETARSGVGCLTCHDTRISPVRWHSSEHKRADVACLDCHGQKDQPHADLARKPASDTCMVCHGEKRAQLSLTSHHPVREGRIDCADCHDPHRPMGREMNREVCLPCHANRRGPFVFEHGAISADLTDGCLDCHQPHGSPNTRLLKLSNRGLCLQCHADKALHFVGTTCWDCHQGLHGSNSSPLLLSE